MKTKGEEREERVLHLQEAADVQPVVVVHEHHVLEEPEEGPRVVLLGLQQVQDPVVLEEQPARALCRGSTGQRTRNMTLETKIPNQRKISDFRAMRLVSIHL